jgi:hypothetical protein
VEVALHGAFRQVEGHGHILHAFFFQVEEYDHIPLHIGKAGQSYIYKRNWINGAVRRRDE